MLCLRTRKASYQAGISCRTMCLPPPPPSLLAASRPAKCVSNHVRMVGFAEGRAACQIRWHPRRKHDPVVLALLLPWVCSSQELLAATVLFLLYTSLSCLCVSVPLTHPHPLPAVTSFPSLTGNPHILSETGNKSPGRTLG